MGSDVLALFAAAGADVTYILTGVRAVPSKLTAREEILLDRFRRCPQRAQNSVLDVADLLAQSGVNKK
jgi:hypothetical protein